MQALLLILFMGLIGALIGGFTNYIAIKMLFRPYHAVYLFGFKLPFTPGLIPKRRDELSVKIGEMVTKHLLTPDVFKQKVLTPETRQFLEKALRQQVEILKEDRYTIKYFADQWHYDIEGKLKTTIEEKIQTELLKIIDQHQKETFKALLPEAVQQELAVKVKGTSELLLEKFQHYIRSDKGYNDILNMVENFFTQKGKLISMLKMLMTAEAIADRVQREMLKLTSEEKIKAIIQSEIDAEYHRLMGTAPADYITDGQVEMAVNQVASSVTGHLNVAHYTRTPLSTLFPQGFNYMETTGIDAVLDKGLVRLADHIPAILEKIHIAALIKDQIDRFELSFIEQLVIEIASKELKLITLLGFILGGIIGLLQGMIALLI
ncbi:UPF0754 membrane protein [Macrococcus hajekii]|nr:DUF445 family protein [Macrococcus hajekii]GGB02083.1 UPF0754 membrane protein [Macrococcus hajekii]